MDTTALVLFNNRVERLLRSGLAERMQHRQYILSREKFLNREWICADGVTEDAIDAFVLNIRLLIQDRDGFSIRQLAAFYESEEVPGELKKRFSEAREQWAKHIAQRTPFKKPDKSANFTYGELFDVLLYGGLAHANPDKAELFYRLTTQGAASAFVFACFMRSLEQLLEVARTIRETNEKLLVWLSATNGLECAR